MSTPKIPEFDKMVAEEEIVTAYKKAARRIHPDKGGSTQEFQELGRAKDAAMAMTADAAIADTSTPTRS